MANAKKCDACGKLYDNNKFDYDLIQSIRILKECHNGVGMVYDMVYDLCDSCYHKLLKFLHEDGEKDD